MSPSMAERVRCGRLRPNVAYACEVCGEWVEKYVPLSEVEKGKARLRFCGRTCKGIALSGRNHPMWAGGRVTRADGYVLVHAPEHPHATSAGYVREHRLVMERYLGRLLEPEEVIHHVNGDVADNRIENLRLFATHAEHKRFENSVRERDEKGRLT